jgi:hypothetical protein
MKLIGCDGVGDTEPAAEQVDKVVEAGKVRGSQNFAHGNRGLVLTKGVQSPNEQPHGEDPQVAPARQEVLAHRDAL